MDDGLRPKMDDLLIAKYRVINHFVKWVSNNMATVFNSSTIDNSYSYSYSYSYYSYYKANYYY